MTASLRSRLLLIFGTAALALVVMLAGSAWIGAGQTRDLRDVEDRLVPKLELGPKLEGAFEHMRQAMQDAVAAQDTPELEATLELRNQLFDLIASTHGVIDPNDAALLRWTIHDYYDVSHDVSRRLIAGETGEELVDEMARMQAQQAKAIALIKRTTGLSERELAGSFAAVANASRRADRFRFGIGLLGLALVLAFSSSVTRSVLRSISNLSRGFARFAVGDFHEPIAASGLAELAQVAREANAMAASLRDLGAQRDRHDWLKESEALVSNEMRGGAEPATIAERALRCIAERTHAAAGALYLLEDGGLWLRGQYALPNAPEFAPLDPLDPHASGRGLLLEAARSTKLKVIEEVPEDYVKIGSGAGEGAPRALAFLPLFWAGETVGVLELAYFNDCPADVREFLGSLQQVLVIGLQAALSRAALKQALQRSQQQAERLAAQEEELRANNQELQSQHEELRVANAELEEQRRLLSTQNEELEEARVRLQQKAEELTRMSAYKSQFLANMSHELRTPLNSMLLLSHLLAQNEAGNLNPKQVEYSKTIHSAGGDLLNLINQVLDLAKIEAGRQELRLEAVPLTRFSEQMRRVFEPLADEKRLKLEISLDPELPERVTTDPQRVERILMNLLGNAVKFTDHGTIRLAFAKPSAGAKAHRPGLELDGCFALIVSDTGIGIPAEAQERVFSPFEQIESHSNRRYAGTGLGLAISRESAALLGGELQLESTPGQGSTFTCYLPMQAAPLLAAAHSKRPSQPEAGGIVDDRAALGAEVPHVLVIEDDAVLAEQLVDIVRARRLKVVVTHSGEEGIALARAHRPQGIVLDVKLPDTDGWSVMERLRNDPVTREIPVHFVSGVDSKERGLALGAVGYLMKPATHAELARAVRALTPSAARDSRRILVVEDSVAEGESLCALLERQSFSAERVGSAREALDQLETRHFDCMILDLGLPDMDGLAVLETLRARGGNDAPRVIVHTGRALSKRETQQLEAYAEAVVLKEGDSAARLLEEIRLFVSHVKDTLPSRVKSRLPPASATAPADVSLSGITLLLAEDDMRTVYALSAMLTGKGAHVLVADTGLEALELLGRHPSVDAVLMDIMMPVMDGYEAMRKIRENVRFQRLPVIALTAKAMKGERERCLEAGANEYLTKPIDADQLLSTLIRFFPGGRDAARA